MIVKCLDDGNVSANQYIRMYQSFLVFLKVEMNRNFYKLENKSVSNLLSRSIILNVSLRYNSSS